MLTSVYFVVTPVIACTDDGECLTSCPIGPGLGPIKRPWCVNEPGYSPDHTITCHNQAECTLVYVDYVGTVTIDPQCNASSPASYPWSLTVNGSNINGTQICSTPAGSCDLGCGIVDVLHKTYILDAEETISCPAGTRLTTTGGSWSGGSCSGTFTQSSALSSAAATIGDTMGSWACVTDSSCALPAPDACEVVQYCDGNEGSQTCVGEPTITWLKENEKALLSFSLFTSDPGSCTPMPGFYCKTVNAGSPSGKHSIEYTCLAGTAPNLVPSTPTVSATTVLQGGSITFNTQNITNTGSAVADPYTIGGFYLDNNNDGNHEYIVAIDPVTSNTAIGGAQSKSATWSVPSNVPPGTYRISYIVDVSNIVTESNEDDNFSGWGTSFTVTAPIDCQPATQGNCVLPLTTSGTSAGSCNTGYGGSCNYSCSNGTWTESSNACVAQSTSISASPSTIWTGNASVITWNTTGYGSIGCDVRSTMNSDRWTGLSGSETTSNLTTSGSYILSCPGGSSPTLKDSALINVTQPTQPDISISPRMVDQGSTAVISWDSNNGNEALCSITGGTLGTTLSPLPSGGDVEIGTYSITVTGKTTYTLTCGALSDTFTVEIRPQGFET